MNPSPAIINPTPDGVLAFRRAIWRGGFRPISVRTAGKAPDGLAWQDRARWPVPDAATAAVHADALNTGVLSDGLRAVDVDADDQELSENLRLLLDMSFAGAPPIRRRSNSNRFLALYRAASGEPRKRSLTWADGSKIEILGRGNQFVADGVHPSGVPLSWDIPLTGIKLTDLPAISEGEIEKFFAAAVRELRALPASRTAGPAGAPGRNRNLTAPLEDVAAAVQILPNDGPPDWDAYKSRAMAIFAATGGCADGYALFQEWSERSQFHEPQMCSKTWDEVAKSPPNNIGFGTLRRLAKQVDPAWAPPSEQIPAEPMPAETLPAASARVVIDVQPGEIHLAADAAETAIIASGIPIFQRGKSLVRPVEQPADAAKGRTTVSATLDPLGPTHMIDLLSQAATFLVPDARAKKHRKQADPPLGVANVVLSRAGMWRLPRVVGVVTTPTLRPDGSLLSEPGYDPATQLYHAADPGLTLASQVYEPSRADAEAALLLLNELLAGFPR